MGCVPWAPRSYHGALLVCSFRFPTCTLHAALRTGRSDAYLATELGWSFRKVEDGHQYFAQWVHQFSLYYVGSVPAIIMWAALVLLILSFYWWMSQFTRTLLHPALWLWTACYAGYLFIFWLPAILYLPYPAAAVPPVATGRRVPAEEPHVSTPAGADGPARLRPVDAPTLGRPGRHRSLLVAALKMG